MKRFREKALDEFSTKPCSHGNLQMGFDERKESKEKERKINVWFQRSMRFFVPFPIFCSVHMNSVTSFTSVRAGFFSFHLQGKWDAVWLKEMFECSTTTEDHLVIFKVFFFCKKTNKQKKPPLWCTWWWSGGQSPPNLTAVKEIWTTVESICNFTPGGHQLQLCSASPSPFSLLA